jgi:hypothetical protein
MALNLGRRPRREFCPPGPSASCARFLRASSGVSIDHLGAAATAHGVVHSVASPLVFVTQPAGAVLVSRRFGPRELWATFIAFAVAAAVFVLNNALSLRATGLSERVSLGVIVSWSALASVRTIRR